eukprot:m51a1_g12327 hypothetical protein (311) ;mRNA; f:459282-460214
MVDGKVKFKVALALCVAGLVVNTALLLHYRQQGCATDASEAGSRPVVEEPFKAPAVHHDLVSVVATIPARVLDGSLQRHVASMRNQTHPPEVIYVALPRHFKRFKAQMDDDEVRRLAGDNDIVLLREDLDPGPIAKYLFLARALARGEVAFERVFVGDDDQQYAPDLLEKMKGLWPRGFRGYMQNDYDRVRGGTGGFAHGFVGLMVHSDALLHLVEWPRPDFGFDVDDQICSICLAFHNVTVVPGLPRRLVWVGGIRGVGANAIFDNGPRELTAQKVFDFYNVEPVHEGPDAGKYLFRDTNLLLPWLPTP